MTLLLLFTLVLFLGPWPTAAADCQVVVRDMSGSPLPSAMLVVTPKFLLPGTNQRAQALRADRDGNVECRSLPPGSRHIWAFKEGHRSVNGWIRIDEPGDFRLTIKLSPIGACKEETGEINLEYLRMPASSKSRISKQLEKFDDSPLCTPVAGSADEAYRFLWLRSFHPAILATVTFLKDGTAHSVVRELKRTGETDYKLVTHDRRGVDNNHWGAEGDPRSAEDYITYWKMALGKYLWKAPAEIVRPPGLDGATWTIEARKAGKCHVVSRWSPDASDAVHYAGSSILRLADWKVYPDEIY